MCENTHWMGEQHALRFRSYYSGASNIPSPTRLLVLWLLLLLILILSVCSFGPTAAIVFFSEAITCCMLLLDFISESFVFVALLLQNRKEILSIHQSWMRLKTVYVYDGATGDGRHRESRQSRKHLCEWLIKYHWKSFTLYLCAQNTISDI